MARATATRAALAVGLWRLTASSSYQVHELEAADDRLLFGRGEPLQRGFIDGDPFRVQHAFERRHGLHVDDVFRQLRLAGAPLLLADQIANPVHDRLPQVGLKSALVPRLEGVQTPERGHDGVLDEIRRFDHSASRQWHPPARPAPQRRDTPLEQLVERRGLAQLDARQQLDRRLRIQRRDSDERLGRLGVRLRGP